METDFCPLLCDNCKGKDCVLNDNGCLVYIVLSGLSEMICEIQKDLSREKS